MDLNKTFEDKVYAGVLGKIIGVYLGRPFEGWYYDRIMKELGPINYYVNENITKNSKYIKNKSMYLLGSKFFNCPSEIVFRSLTKILKEIGKKYYSARGKSILNILEKINGHNFNKLTLSGCIIEKLNNSVIIYKEFPKKS